MLDKRGWRRSEWTMITQANHYWFEIENGFCGVVEMLEVSEPFKAGKQKLTICDAGITWVQCAWNDVSLWATAMFDASGKLVQIYFDVCDEVHLDGEGSWFTDLFLDVVYDPNGTVCVLDEEELFEACRVGKVTERQKECALQSARKLVKELESDSKQVNNWFVQLYEKSSKNALK